MPSRGLDIFDKHFLFRLTLFEQRSWTADLHVLGTGQWCTEIFYQGERLLPVKVKKISDLNIQNNI